MNEAILTTDTNGTLRTIKLEKKKQCKYFMHVSGLSIFFKYDNTSLFTGSTFY